MAIQLTPQQVRYINAGMRPAPGAEAARQARIHAAASRAFAASGGPDAARQARIQHAAALGFAASGPAAPAAAGQTPGTSATTTTSATTPPAPPAPPAPPGGTSPLDSTYFANVAANLAKVQNEEAGLRTTRSNNFTNLQQALAQLSYQQPRDALSMLQAANRSGAIGSSVYGQNLGNLGQQYTNRRTTAQTAYDQSAYDIDQQIAALEQGIPLFNQQEAAASGQRLIDAAANDPSTGQTPIQAPLTPEQVKYINAGMGITPNTPRPRAPAGGGHYVWNNGRWNLIHATGPGRWAPGPPPRARTRR